MTLLRSEKILVEDSLTRADKVIYAEKFAAMIGKMESLEDDKKEYTANVNRKIKTIEESAREHAAIVRSGVIARLVECHLRYDFEAGVVHYHRWDTGERVKKRPISQSERQMKLDDIKPSRWDILFPWESWVPIRQNFAPDVERLQDCWDLEYLEAWFEHEMMPNGFGVEEVTA